MLYTHSYHFDTPFGDISIATTEDAVTAIWFPARARQIPVDLNLAQQAETPLIKETAAWIRAYLDKKRPDPSSIPITLEGSDFRKEVLQMVATVPYGQVISYGEIAKEMARRRGMEKMAAQAVGGAVGSNKILLLIPCHRVVGAKGSLGGYGCGLDIKRWLLAHERD